MQRCPNQACPAPTKLRIEKRRQRPSDRARKTRDQSNASDRSAGGAAVEPGQCGESGIIKAHRHADAEHSPSDSQSKKSLYGTEQDKPGGKNQIRKCQYAATATVVERPADGRTQHGRQQQRAREEAEYSCTRQGETLRDRVRQDRRQIVARSPGERLRGAKGCDNDRPFHPCSPTPPASSNRSTITQSRQRPSSFP